MRRRSLHLQIVPSVLLLHHGKLWRSKSQYEFGRHTGEKSLGVSAVALRLAARRSLCRVKIAPIPIRDIEAGQGSGDKCEAQLRGTLRRQHESVPAKTGSCALQFSSSTVRLSESALRICTDSGCARIFALQNQTPERRGHESGRATKACKPLSRTASAPFEACGRRCSRCC